MRSKKLEDENFEKMEVNGEEIWKKYGIWKSKSEEWSRESCRYGDVKNVRERRLKSEK